MIQRCRCSIWVLLFLLGPALNSNALTVHRKLQDIIPVSTGNPVDITQEGSEWVSTPSTVFVNTEAPVTDWGDLGAVPQGTSTSQACAGTTWPSMCNGCVHMSTDYQSSGFSCNFPRDSDMEFFTDPMCCDKMGVGAPPGSDGLNCCDAPSSGGCLDSFGESFQYEHCCFFQHCV